MMGPRYIALYGPEARRDYLWLLLGANPMIIGEGVITDNALSFAHRRGGGVVPTLTPAEGQTVPAIVYWFDYYEQRRLERRLGYPMGIARGTYDAMIGGIHPTRVLCYYVPLIRPRGIPSDDTVSKMQELYTYYGWDMETINSAINADATPVIRRIK